MLELFRTLTGNWSRETCLSLEAAAAAAARRLRCFFSSFRFCLSFFTRSVGSFDSYCMCVCGKQMPAELEVPRLETAEVGGLQGARLVFAHTHTQKNQLCLRSTVSMNAASSSSTNEQNRLLIPSINSDSNSGYPPYFDVKTREPSVRSMYDSDIRKRL